MPGKNKAIIGIAIVAVLVAGFFSLNKKKTADHKATDISAGTELNKATDDEKGNLLQMPSGNTIEGTLQVSNNKKKGNLMLVTSNRTVYISTSRNFDQLVGKDVTVTYEGTLDNFVLGDIVAK